MLIVRYLINSRQNLKIVLIGTGLHAWSTVDSELLTFLFSEYSLPDFTCYTITV